MCFGFFSLGGIVLETCRDWSMVDYARGSYEPKTLPTSPLINLNLAENQSKNCFCPISIEGRLNLWANYSRRKQISSWRCIHHPEVGICAQPINKCMKSMENSLGPLDYGPGMSITRFLDGSPYSEYA